jgi:hypothetical protein
MKIRLALAVRLVHVLDVPELDKETFDKWKAGSLSEEEAEKVRTLVDDATPPIAPAFDEMDVYEELYEESFPSILERFKENPDDDVPF